MYGAGYSFKFLYHAPEDFSSLQRLDAGNNEYQQSMSSGGNLIEPVFIDKPSFNCHPTGCFGLGEPAQLVDITQKGHDLSTMVQVILVDFLHRRWN